MDFGDPLAVVVPGVHGKVLAVLARSGLPLTGKRAAELADVSIERTRQVLHRLVDSGLIESQRAGQAVLFEINRAHLLWPAVQALVTAADQVVWAVEAAHQRDDRRDPRLAGLSTGHGCLVRVDRPG
ncbi:MAG: hypothetical protein NVV70_11475 [Cellulomonas sp.]|nr:hypothetical protein [Cellulomonas sp.]MCR6648714.1 hypothetical protein [Cellulomonas sp.]